MLVSSSDTLLSDFVCGFDFRHSLRLPFAAIFISLEGVNYPCFVVLMSGAAQRARESRIAICSHFINLEGVNYTCFVVPVGTLGPFSPADNPFQTVKGLVDYVYLQ